MFSVRIHFMTSNTCIYTYLLYMYMYMYSMYTTYIQKSLHKIIIASCRHLCSCLYRVKFGMCLSTLNMYILRVCSGHKLSQLYRIRCIIIHERFLLIYMYVQRHLRCTCTCTYVYTICIMCMF